MGNKHSKVPPDEIMVDFKDIKTKQDAVRWIQKHFPNEKQRIVSILQRDNCRLSRKSYVYSKKSNEIIIYFGLRHDVTQTEMGTSFRYSPRIKS